MNVFDFDKTIFHGDSTAKFYLHCLRKYPSILKYAPSLVYNFLKFTFKKCTKTQFKEVMYRFLLEVPDVDKEVQLFWDKNIDGVFDWYKKVHCDSDVVISASPEFLLCGICEKLKVEKLIASRVNKKTGKYEGVNCHGEEKVRRFYECYPEGEIDAFYSDSVSDAPLARIAKEAYVINNRGEVAEWEKVFPGTSIT